MSDSTVLDPPQSVFHQPRHFSTDWNSFVTSFGKSLFKALYGRFVTNDSDDVKEGIADALGSFGLQLETEAKIIAWKLCRQALGTALVELIRPEQVRTLPEDAPEKAFREKFIEQIDWAMIRLDTSFFEHPEQFPFLGPVKVILEEWLVMRDMPHAEAQNIARRLPSHFVFALHDEWRKKPNEYKALEQYIRTPYRDATDRARAWLRYAAELKKACDASMFGETFGLAQVYVPLRAYHEEHLDGGRDRRSFRHEQGEKQRVRRTVVKVDDKLDAWVKAGEKNDALRVLSGGPGSGKSSCAKMFAARMAEQSRHVLLIPLHRVNYEADISKIVLQFVREGQQLPFDPLETQSDEPLLLIFDGLDELSERGKSGAEAAKGLLDEILRFLDARNHSRLRVQVLVGGREIVVQQARKVLREPKRILTLMPYFVSPEARENEKRQGIDYEAVPGDFDQDQRVSWWNQYTAAKGQPPGMPAELQRTGLVEITGQPLLNYLVALSRERKTLNLVQNALRNRIYLDLLEGVYERARREHKPHPGTSALNHEDFVELLEEIALAVWHGNGRTATVKEIHALCGNRIDKLLEQYESGEARVMGLLTAFYFRKHHERRDADDTFEFTHKSFGEYLTARRIVRALKDIHQDREEATKRRPWNMKDSLRDWAKICGQTTLEVHVLRFVIDEVALKDHGSVAQWQQVLQDLISYMLRHGMPMEDAKLANYLQAMVHARNAEETLLACLYACSERTKTVSRIDWPDEKSAWCWLHRLHGQAAATKRVLALKCLGRLDFSNCDLDSLDLRGANLQHANLCNTDLTASDLDNADLEGASLIGASLHFAFLGGADLANTDLRKANLSNATLDSANLKRADLQGATLHQASLCDAVMREANLTDANLSEATLYRANLCDAVLENADLHGADLRRANLKGAALANTRVDDADMTEAVLDPPNYDDDTPH